LRIFVVELDNCSASWGLVSVCPASDTVGDVEAANEPNDSACPVAAGHTDWRAREVADVPVMGRPCIGLEDIEYRGY